MSSYLKFLTFWPTYAIFEICARFEKDHASIHHCYSSCVFMGVFAFVLYRVYANVRKCRKSYKSLGDYVEMQKAASREARSV